MTTKRPSCKHLHICAVWFFFPRKQLLRQPLYMVQKIWRHNKKVHFHKTNSRKMIKLVCDAITDFKQAVSRWPPSKDVKISLKMCLWMAGGALPTQCSDPWATSAAIFTTPSGLCINMKLQFIDCGLTSFTFPYLTPTESTISPHFCTWLEFSHSLPLL